MDYTKLAITATRLIASTGLPFELRRDTNTDYDTTTALVEGSEAKWNSKAVRIEYKLSDVDTALVQVGDFKLLISVDGMTLPRPGDRCTFDGDNLKVINCTPIKPAGIALAYEIQARR